MVVCALSSIVSACKIDEGKQQSRKQMISEISRFRQAILKKDKQGIASFFDFPVRSESIWYNTVTFDNMENKEGVRNGMSKKIFLKETDRIITNSLLPFFMNLKPEALGSRDTVTKQVVLKNEPCMNQYSITIEDDSIVVYELKMGVNEQYNFPEDTGDVMDPSSLCEHFTWWKFGLRNGKLKFISLDGAD